MTAHLEVRGISKQFSGKHGSVLALDDINLHVEAGEFVCLVGASGCGKSTLLSIIAGLQDATAGEVLLDGEQVEGPGPDRGLVFQSYSLFPWRTVSENIAFGLELAGMDKHEIQRRVDRYLDVMKLTQWAKARPSQLSGGMRQRVAIARAFAVQPSILLADEAFGHLDEVTAAELRERFLALARECGSTAILITHQLEEAIGVGDRIIVFGKSAKLLADIHVARWGKSDYGVLREAIQATLQSNERDARLVRP